MAALSYVRVRVPVVYKSRGKVHKLEDCTRNMRHVQLLMTGFRLADIDLQRGIVPLV